jgi:DNA-binding transcriptional LysR family regulator
VLNVVHLRTLQAVLDTGSLSGAARELKYTTSAVSQQIAALERSLGVRLFERGPQSLWPTAAALQVRIQANEILARLDEVEQDMRAFTSGKRGRLRVGAFATAAAQLLPRALARLMSASPDIELILQEGGESVVLADAVHEGRIDLAVVFEYDLVPRSWPNDLTVSPILDEELVIICAAQRSPARESRRAVLTDFADDIWVGSGAASASHENMMRVCGQAGFEPDVRFQTNDFDVIRGIVRANLGVALIPSLALGIDRSISLVRLEPEVTRRKVAALHRGADPNPLVPVLVDAIREAAKDFEDWTTEAFGVRVDSSLAIAHPRVPSD